MSSLEDRKGSPRRREDGKTGNRVLTYVDVGMTVAAVAIFLIDGSSFALFAALLNGNEIARGFYLGRPKA